MQIARHRLRRIIAAIGLPENFDVHVKVFGQSDCSNDPAKPVPCNLHSVWDSRLIARHNLDEPTYFEALQKIIADKNLADQPPGTPAQWAEQSVRLAKEALVKDGEEIDDGYYRRHITVIDERMALAGIRLAASLNQILVAAPPR